ncbi:HEAT repeat domain-containing protein [Calditrichota bacterium LG25]
MNSKQNIVNKKRVVLLLFFIVLFESLYIFILTKPDDPYELATKLSDLSFSYDEVNDIKERLVKVGDPAVEPLCSLLTNKRSVVRSRAAEVFGQLKNPKSVQPLIQAMILDVEDIKQGEYIDYFGRASRALSKIGNPCIKPIIELILKNQDDDYLLREAIEALQSIDDTSGVNLLFKKLNENISNIENAVFIIRIISLLKVESKSYSLSFFVKKRIIKYSKIIADSLFFKLNQNLLNFDLAKHYFQLLHKLKNVYITYNYPTLKHEMEKKLKKYTELEEYIKISGSTWIDDFKLYLKKRPRGLYSKLAKREIAWLKKQKAVIDIEYPETLVYRGSGSQAIKWEWTTTFKEKGGKLPFELKGTGWLYDKKGHKWGISSSIFDPFISPINRGEIFVKPNGEDHDYYYVKDSNHDFCGGYALFKWVGRDGGGHKIKLIEKVYFIHPNCMK